MKILVAGNGGPGRENLLRTLRDNAALSVSDASGDDDTLWQFEKHSPDGILVFVGREPAEGWNLLQMLRIQAPARRLVALTAGSMAEARRRCAAIGVDACFERDGPPGSLLAQLASWMPPLPVNEPQRLLAVQRLHMLDTPSEAAFDTAARTAAYVADAPCSLISLIDADRQWFKARVGIRESEISRVGSFCAFTILGCDLLEVEQVFGDPRFEDIPLVRGETAIRSYAGVPLVLSSGEAVGTLCVMDRATRRLSAGQREALETLARGVVSELEARRRLVGLQEEAAVLRASDLRTMDLARNDLLTGLPNRAAMLERLKQALATAERDRSALALLLIDLDRFKAINETLGHAFGDAVLQRVALRLGSAVRASDVVARFSGDGFAVLLPGLTQFEYAERVAGKIVEALMEPFEHKGRTIEIGGSVGLAAFPRHAESESTLLRYADLALSHAKQAGGRRFATFEQSMDAEAFERMALECELRAGIEAGELELHYQPQIRLCDGAVSGFEALARWRHPRMGLLPPARFIRLAEDTGLIAPLGRFVLNEALRQVAEWHGQGLQVPSISVNVSPLQLSDNFASMLAALIATHGVDSRQVVIELTESALTADGPAVNGILEAIHEQGIGIAVDDFGVGYSSLALLRRLPITSLKIDRSFISELLSGPRDTAIVQAMLTMASSLGLQSVAEGVERYEQDVALRKLGCEHGQGYLYSQPMPAHLVGDWLREAEFGARFWSQGP